MTKEEAINKLIRIRQVQGSKSEAHEALGMAIDALAYQAELPEGLEEAARHSEMLTYPMPEDGDIEKVMKVQEARIFHEIGFIAGAEWKREQMMEKAVEGRVFMSFAPGHNQMVMADVDLPTNTKVRVIVIPEE